MAPDPDDLAKIDRIRAALADKDLWPCVEDAGDGCVRVVLVTRGTDAVYRSPSAARELFAWREAAQWASGLPRTSAAIPGRPLVVDGEARVAPLVRGKGAA